MLDYKKTGFESILFFYFLAISQRFFLEQFEANPQEAERDCLMLMPPP